MTRFNKDQVIAAAQRAAVEATNRERARCLWAIDRLLQQTAAGLNDKLIPAAEQQLVKLRFEMTKSICQALRMVIAGGFRPPAATATPAPGQKGNPDAPPSEIIVP